MSRELLFHLLAVNLHNKGLEDLVDLALVDNLLRQIDLMCQDTGNSSGIVGQFSIMSPDKIRANTYRLNPY